MTIAEERLKDLEERDDEREEHETFILEASQAVEPELIELLKHVYSDSLKKQMGA